MVEHFVWIIVDKLIKACFIINNLNWLALYFSKHLNTTLAMGLM